MWQRLLALPLGGATATLRLWVSLVPEYNAREDAMRQVIGALRASRNSRTRCRQHVDLPERGLHTEVTHVLRPPK
ncbi:hypothetical protein EVG20_g10619 [Dentipellis fragilis]|uniref:Secreted protein n=1 Tax=Dentipellis fragilis TaxID=205917 RepID=A0A4Y9XSA6_9AGAM|nr:hypothetical protein EVG20_g10619 [Dentipellis fragilis]